MAVTEHPYVERAREPLIAGTRTTVRAIVENYRLGLKPEEIVQAMPHLNLAQVFDALSYSHDHPEEIRLHIEANRALVDASSELIWPDDAEHGESPRAFFERLRKAS